jgi:hypothetical protein
LVCIVSSTFGQEDEIVDDGSSTTGGDSSAATTWIILLICAWFWHAGRNIAISGLDYVIRQPQTLAAIIAIMYVIAWGLIELSFTVSGGYDPIMKSFGNGGTGDDFTVCLVLFSAGVCIILWGSCKKCAERYSTFAQMRKAEKSKAKNP